MISPLHWMRHLPTRARPFKKSRQSLSRHHTSLVDLHRPQTRHRPSCPRMVQPRVRLPLHRPHRCHHLHDHTYPENQSLGRRLNHDEAMLWILYYFKAVQIVHRNIHTPGFYTLLSCCLPTLELLCHRGLQHRYSCEAPSLHYLHLLVVVLLGFNAGPSQMDQLTLAHHLATCLRTFSAAVCLLVYR